MQHRNEHHFNRDNRHMDYHNAIGRPYGTIEEPYFGEKRTCDATLPVGVASVAPLLPAKVDLVPSPPINPEKPKFFVTLEMICHPKANGPWVKNYELKNKVIVIPDLIEDDTVQTLRMKIKKENANCIPGKQWRVFFPQTLPDWIVWKNCWHLRKEYLVDMTDGEKTLKDIGIGPDNNRLFYFFQVQFVSRDEP